MTKLDDPIARTELEPNVFEAFQSLGATEYESTEWLNETVKLTIDTVPFDHKPQSQEIAQITQRLKRPESVMDLNYERFCNAIRMGVTWCGAVFEGGWGDKYFKSQQLFALDVDNKVDVLDEYGDKKLNPDGSVCQHCLQEFETLYLDPLHALQRAYMKNLNLVCLYFSKSATLENPRFRMVFDVGSPVTDVREAKDVLKYFMSFYPECDQVCKNLNRLWFGSNGEIWEAWRVRTVEHGVG